MVGPLKQGTGKRVEAGAPAQLRDVSAREKGTDLGEQEEQADGGAG